MTDKKTVDILKKISETSSPKIDSLKKINPLIHNGLIQVERTFCGPLNIFDGYAITITEKGQKFLQNNQ